MELLRKLQPVYDASSQATGSRKKARVTKKTQAETALSVAIRREFAARDISPFTRTEASKPSFNATLLRLGLQQNQVNAGFGSPSTGAIIDSFPGRFYRLSEESPQRPFRWSA